MVNAHSIHLLPFSILHGTIYTVLVGPHFQSSVKHPTKKTKNNVTHILTRISDFIYLKGKQLIKQNVTASWCAVVFDIVNSMTNS